MTANYQIQVIFLVILNEHIHEVQIKYLEAFLMFGNIKPWELGGSSFRCEDLILKCFCLWMLNDKMLKPNNEICSKCEYHFKQKTMK